MNNEQVSGRLVRGHARIYQQWFLGSSRELAGRREQQSNRLALLIIHSHRIGCAMPFLIILDHHWDLELLQPSRRKGYTDIPTGHVRPAFDSIIKLMVTARCVPAMFNHPGHLFRCAETGGADEIPLIFSVLIVYDHKEFASRKRFYCGFNIVETELLMNIVFDRH